MRKVVAYICVALLALPAFAGTVTQTSSATANALPRHEFWKQVNGEEGTAGVIYNITSVDLPAIITELNARLTTITSSNATFTGTVQAEQLTSTDDVDVADDVRVGDDLDVTGKVYVAETVEVDGDVDLDATGGSTGDPDLSVDGYAKFGGTVELDADVDLDADIVGDGSSSAVTNLLYLEADQYIVGGVAGISTVVTNVDSMSGVTNILTYTYGIITGTATP
jgi:cytoskeletal protein CcmA (bactofilin family)